MKKISSAVFAVLFASLAIAQVDIRMDTQVADVLSIGTNVVLSSKAPASTYFVVNRVMSQAVGTNILSDVVLRLTTATGIQYIIPVTNDMNTATNFVIVTPPRQI